MTNTNLTSSIKAKVFKPVLVAVLGFMSANGVIGGALMLAPGAAMAAGNFSSEFKVCKTTINGNKSLLKLSKSENLKCKEVYSLADNGDLNYWSYSRNNSKYCHKDNSVCKSLATAGIMKVTASNGGTQGEVTSGAITFVDLVQEF